MKAYEKPVEKPVVVLEVPWRTAETLFSILGKVGGWDGPNGRRTETDQLYNQLAKLGINKHFEEDKPICKAAGCGIEIIYYREEN